MTETGASLSDYLFLLRRGARPGRLMLAIGIGSLVCAVGLYRGPKFAGLTGLGVAVAGVCSWARLNQLADSSMDGAFGAAQSRQAKQLRAAGIAALGIGAAGSLLFLYSLAVRFVFGGATGL